MTIRETIKKGMINLKTNGIEEPNLKARLLMQFILNKPRQYLLIIQLLKSENMHKLAFFLCRWDEPDSFVKSGKFLQRRMVRI